jgi:hypothetical protein
MTNTQMFLAIGIPSFLVLVGILLNQLGQNRVENWLGVIEGDLRQFYAQGRHDKAIEIIEKKLDK